MANGPKRQTNVNLKDKRKRSWNRGQVRKQQHIAANEAARKENDAKLKAAGLTRTKTEIIVKVNGTTKVVVRPDSPQRTFRKAGLEWPED